MNRPLTDGGRMASGAGGPIAQRTVWPHRVVLAAAAPQAHSRALLIEYLRDDGTRRSPHRWRGAAINPRDGLGTVRGD